MVEIFHDYYTLTLFLLLATISVFDIWPVFSAEDGFFGIFPEEYYDPNEYDQESAGPDKLTKNILRTIKEIN